MDLVVVSARLERELNRFVPLIAVHGKAAFQEGWQNGPFEEPDVWRARLAHHRGNVALVTGHGLAALDPDLYKSPAAEDAWRALLEDTGLDPDTVRSITGRGGMHVLYTYPPELHVPSISLEQYGYPYIECKADGGCIVVYPSVTDRQYHWEEGGWAPGERALAPLSDKFLALVGATSSNGRTARGRWHQLDDETLATLDPRDVECMQLLIEHFGGHDPALTNGVIALWRPGKESRGESASATIGYIGPGVAKCWTDGWAPFKQGQVVDVEQLKNMKGLGPKIEVPTLELPDGYRPWTPSDDVLPDPALSRDAYHGPVGEYLDLLDGNTEAHPAAVGIEVLSSVGTLIGRRAGYGAGRERHHANLFVAVVGPSSEGAKGVADNETNYFMQEVDSGFLARHAFSGLASGEALVAELDDTQGGERRRIITDAELSAVLKTARREGSILGDTLRKAFDGTPLFHKSLTRGRLVATNHHVAVVGSITPDDLRALVDQLAIANGFANRFLYIWSRLTTFLPHGARLDQTAITRIAKQVTGALEQLDGRIMIDGSVWLPFTDPARDRWDDFYRRRRTGIGEGLFRALTGRQVAHAARLSVIYATLDGATEIDEAHVLAAAAWCDYSVATAEKVFTRGIAGQAGKLLVAVRESMPDGITGTDLHRGVAHNWRPGEFDTARRSLEERRLVFVFRLPTAGRSRELYIATAPIGRKEERAER